MAVLLTSHEADAQSAQGCRPSIASLRETAIRVWNDTHDGNRVISSIDRLLPGSPTDPSSLYIDDGSHDGLAFTLTFPARAYRELLTEALRKREPFQSLSVPERVAIDVSVSRIDAPDIEKVIVERGGSRVIPLSGALTPVAKVTRLGARFVVNEGTLTYPCTAFMPGEDVVVTGIPSVGANITRRFTSDELRVHALGERPEGDAALTKTTTECVRPTTIGLLDWNHMSAEQKAATCVPTEVKSDACPRPATIGLLEWNRMTTQQKAAACAK